MYRSKLVGKPLVLDVAHLLKKIQEGIQVIFRTDPARTAGLLRPGSTGIGVGAARYRDAQFAKRNSKARAESWKGKATMYAIRSTIR